jgi:hypothetical protein
LHASASDPSPGSGLGGLDYTLDGSNWIGLSSPASLPDGVHSLQVRASDLAGNTSHSQADEIKIDSLAPALTISESGTGGANGWYISPAQVSASAQDGGSGLAALEVSRNGAAWTAYAIPISLPDGTHSLSFWAEDMAGWVTEETRQIRVDTQAPDISGNINGTIGTNNWYTSSVTLTALAADPEPGSGIETFTYALNGVPAQAYTTPLTLTDGQHNLTLTARDRAGLETTETLTIWVDTVPPALQITSQYPEWVKDSLSLAGSASDGGSGLARVEVTFDNGQTWHPLGSADDWRIKRDTREGSSGAQTWYARAVDKAGLSTIRSINMLIDNTPPRIDLPESWNLWDTVTFNARDADSGLAQAELVISDPQNRWPKRVYTYQPGHLPHQFKWDRRFGDGTLAPLGDYQVKASAVDRMGNVQIVYATLRISLGETILIPPTATPLGAPLPTATPTATPQHTAEPSFLTPSPTPTGAAGSVSFGATQQPAQPSPTSALSAPPRETPAESPFTSWLGSLFTPPASATIPPLAEPDGINWGAGALAAAAGMSAYYLSKRREEEEAQRRAVREQVAAKNDALRAKEAQMREQAKIQNYLQGKAMLEAQLAQSDLSDDEKAAIRAQAQAEGMAAGLNLTAAAVAARTAPVPVKRKVKSSILPSNETPDKTSSVWRFLREHDSEGSLVFGPDWNRNGGRVAQFALDNYKLSNLVYQFTGDGNTNCSNFLSHMWWQAGVRFPGSGWNIEKFKERPFDTVVWQQVGPQQGIFSSYHGEFRIVYSNGRGEPGVLRDQPSFNNILENFPQIFQPGSAVFYYNSYYEHKYSWQHAAILVGIDNPSNYFSPSSLNSNSHPAVVEQDGLFDVNDKPRAVRSLDDTGTTTLSQISLVPAQPINPAHYNISPSDLPAASLDGKDCYILRSGGESEFSLYYCPPTLPTVP